MTTPYAPREPYLLTPLNPKKAARYILGPALGPSYSELVAENQRLRRRIDDLKREDAQIPALIERWENESALRVQAQQRLNRSMRVLASLGRLSPRMADLVAAARREVFGE